MSRVFESDLSIASHLNDFTKFCAYATQLTAVDMLQSRFKSTIHG